MFDKRFGILANQSIVCGITEISSIQETDRCKITKVFSAINLGLVCQTIVSVTIINLGLCDFMYIMYIIKEVIN